ncbi:hypothetical protein OIU76_027360 [Salix suchowensis]|nr:hypothetical protein OIU76_027360 [Salix suchowensis]
MIRGLSLSESPFLALEYYVYMISSGTEPNEYTFPSVFKSCTKIRGVYEGKQVHAHVLKLGLEHNAFVHTSLINMYAQNARELFDEIPVRDVVSWNAIISGYAQSGRVEEAIAFFEEMRRAKVTPNVSTMLSVLSACAQSGSSLHLGNWDSVLG